jgi:glucose-6-phosphate isomerase
MFPKINPTGTAAWKSLEHHAKEMKQLHMKELFATDVNRFKKYAYAFNDLVPSYTLPYAIFPTSQFIPKAKM